MLNFLKQTRKFINAKEATCIVLGNESCDLDSACSALCLAYLLQQDKGPLNHIKSCQFLPVLNIPRREYALKTEVHYLLKKHEISETMLTFRDELHTDFLANSEFILVDHHVSPFTAKCVAVYDHRPKEINAVFPNDCLVNMDMVGSCATLIAEVFLDKTTKNRVDMEKCGIAYHLLRDTIVLDTVNFSPSAGRSTPRDEKICCCLENLLKSQSNFQDRENTFQLLRKARTDVSALTAAQLLRKDLKILRNLSETIGIALPGFPLLVQDFIKKFDVESALKDFANEQGCQLVLLLGMFIRDDDRVERDIGLISIGEDTALRNIVEANLLTSKEPTLNLESHEDCDFMSGRFYKQKNIKATRKHILPIVKQTLESFQAE